MGRANLLNANRKLQKMKTIRSTARQKLKLARVSSQRQRNVDTLRSIIPGCEEVDLETVFLKTMEHIIKLELQHASSPDCRLQHSLFMGRANLLNANRKLQKMKTIRSTARQKLKLARVSSQRQRNVDTLRSIIPGCEEVDLETVFLKTMEHIIKLELQVHILKSLTDFYGA